MTCTQAVLFAFFLFLPIARGATKSPAPDPVALFKSYLRVDTSNPPGHEMRAVRFWKRFFDKEGIEVTVYDMGHDRGNVLARIRGSGRKHPFIFLNHLDVVPADRARWKEPPFSAIERDGRIYGRGAVDMKGSAVSQALELVTAKREKWKLDRDLIFLGTADEEAGDQSGVLWMLEKHARDLGDPELVMTEGNDILVKDGKTFAWNVATAEKTRLELHLVAHGIASHPVDFNSKPAIPKLMRALQAISAFPFPIVPIPSVERYFKQMVPYVSPDRQKAYADIRATLKDEAWRDRLLKDEDFGPLLHSTSAITMLKAGEKENIVPGEASAVVDMRLMPGDDPKAVVAQLRKAIDDSDVEITYPAVEAAGESSNDTDLFRAILKARDTFDPGIPVMTPPLTSTTDAPFFRQRGIVVYGFEPFRLSDEDDHSHGDDEFLSRANLDFSIKVTRFIAEQVTRSP